MNCTLTENLVGNGTVNVYLGTFTITNCIIYNNTSTYDVYDAATTTMTYSMYENQTGCAAALTGCITWKTTLEPKVPKH